MRTIALLLFAVLLGCSSDDGKAASGTIHDRAELQTRATQSFEEIYIDGTNSDPFLDAISADLTNDFTDQELTEILSLDWENDETIYANPLVLRFLTSSAQSISRHEAFLSQDSTSPSGTQSQALVTQECVALTADLRSSAASILRTLRAQGAAGVVLYGACSLGATTGPAGIGLCAAGFAFLLWTGVLEANQPLSSFISQARQISDTCDPELCGDEGQLCCATSPACDLGQDLTCSGSGICERTIAVECGQEGEPCCSPDSSCGSGLECAVGFCQIPDDPFGTCARIKGQQIERFYCESGFVCAELNVTLRSQITGEIYEERQDAGCVPEGTKVCGAIPDHHGGEHQFSIPILCNAEDSCEVYEEVLSGDGGVSFTDRRPICRPPDATVDCEDGYYCLTGETCVSDGICYADGLVQCTGTVCPSTLGCGPEPGMCGGLFCQTSSVDRMYYGQLDEPTVEETKFPQLNYEVSAGLGEYYTVEQCE